MEGGTCASMAHSPAYNKCVSGPCEQCRKADARHADAVVSSVIMMSRHTTLSLLDVVVCRIVCQNRKRMVVNFVVPIQKLLQPEGTLASSSLFKLMGPKSASLVLSCCLSAVSTCSFATRLAALAFVASRSPVKTVKIWLIWLACPTPCRRPGTSALACRAAQGCT